MLEFLLLDLPIIRWGDFFFLLSCIWLGPMCPVRCESVLWSSFVSSVFFFSFIYFSVHCHDTDGLNDLRAVYRRLVEVFLKGVLDTVCAFYYAISLVLTHFFLKALRTFCWCLFARLIKFSCISRIIPEMCLAPSFILIRHRRRHQTGHLHGYLNWAAMFWAQPHRSWSHWRNSIPSSSSPFLIYNQIYSFNHIFKVILTSFWQ